MSFRSFKMPTLQKMEIIKSVGKKCAVERVWMNWPHWEDALELYFPPEAVCILKLSDLYSQGPEEVSSFLCALNSLFCRHKNPRLYGSKMNISQERMLPSARAWWAGLTRIGWDMRWDPWLKQASCMKWGLLVLMLSSVHWGLEGCSCVLFRDT